MYIENALLILPIPIFIKTANALNLSSWQATVTFCGQVIIIKNIKFHQQREALAAHYDFTSFQHGLF